MNYSMRYLCGAILLVGQTLILAPCHAQVVSESDSKDNPPVSISSESLPQNNINLPDESSSPENTNQRTEVIVSESNNSVPAVVKEPSSRIPVFSRIFNHPAMQQ